MSSPSPNPGVLSFEQARHAVEAFAKNVPAPPTELADLLQSVGRTLAEPIVADRDLPPFDRSARDGFAVRSEDLRQAPVTLRCVAELRAGDPIDKIAVPLAAGECIEIMTGAAVPSGADAVVMVEHTTEVGDQITFSRSIMARENIVHRGSEARAGQILVEPGSHIGHAIVALAASSGKRRAIRVYARPTVAILSTGDELVDLEASPEPHQIRNSNSYSLAAQIIRAGATPLLLPIAIDEPKRLAQLISEGLQCDMLLITGGVSMGKYDFVEQVLEQFSPRFHFTGALIQPGKPIVFLDAAAPSSERRVPVFGLPGNPVSTMVTFELFVRPVLEALCGISSRPLRWLQAPLAAEVRTKTGLTRFLPAHLNGQGSSTRVELTRWQGSGDVVSVARSNCYIVIPPDRDLLAAGEYVSILVPGADL